MGKIDDVPISKEVDELMKSYDVNSNGDKSIYRIALEQAFTAKGAISVLTNLLRRPHMRGDGKSTMTAMVDAALIRAIMSLDKELKEEKGNG